MDYVSKAKQRGFPVSALASSSQEKKQSHFHISFFFFLVQNGSRCGASSSLHIQEGVVKLK